MHIKKIAVDRVLEMIENEIDLQHSIKRLNKFQINKFAKEQKIIKAELSKLYELRKLIMSSKKITT